MRRPPRVSALVLALVPLLAAVSSGATPQRPLRLAFEGPPALLDQAAQLRWLPEDRWQPLVERLGLASPGPPIRVVLLPEEHPVARRTPRWVTGFAVAEEDLVVLLPERVVSYPYDSLDALLTHEVTHVLLARAAQGRPLPRWFQEGVALHVTRERELADAERLLVGGIRGVPPSTAALDRAFAGEGYAVDTAYAVAGALVGELVHRHGDDAVAKIAAGVGAGRSFDAAFAAAAGEPLAGFEAAFWRGFRWRWRWVPFLTSGATLWLGITALALLATARRRQRDAAIRRRWEEEERAELAALAPASTATDVADAEESPWGPN